MVHISCLLWFIGVAQGAATADCSGSSCLPRSSLLQVKSNARRQSASMETHSSLKAQLSEYAKFTEEMVAKYGQDPPPNAAEEGAQNASVVSKEEHEAVRVVLQFIEDMYLSLLKWHLEDEKRAAQCTKEKILDHCKMIEEKQWQIGNHSADVDRLAQEHLDCRNQGMLDCPVPPPQCPDYDAYRKDIGTYAGYPIEAQLPACVRSTPDSAAFADPSIQTTNMDQLGKMEDCLRKTKKWLDPLYRRYDECSREEDTCTAVCPDCQAKQRAFEQKHCLWHSELSLNCKGVNECGSDETELCVQECADIEVRESARVADNETGQRLVCLLHVIFGRPHDVHSEDTEWDPRPSDEDRPKQLKKCKLNEYVSPDWNIQCTPGSWTAPAPCKDAKPATCSEDFIDSWYTKKGNFAEPCGTLAKPCDCRTQVSGRHVDVCLQGEQCPE